jgi:hypothetical protein
MDEEQAKIWNKTAVYGNTCKACGRVFLLKNITWWDSKWEDRNGEESLIETLTKCPHCCEIRSYGRNELELHQPTEDGAIPSR